MFNVYNGHYVFCLFTASDYPFGIFSFLLYIIFYNNILLHYVIKFLAVYHILYYYTLCKFLTLSIHFIGQAAFVNFH
jgi:hypothetical protein